MDNINIIYNQDCISGLRDMVDDESIDLIVTDPPYLISYKTNSRKGEHRFKHEILNDDNEGLIHDYVRECYRILKPDHAMYMFCSSKTLDYFMQESKSAGFKIKNTIVWDKGGMTKGDLKGQFGSGYEPCLLLNKGCAVINGKRERDIWFYPKVVGDKQVHQNQKPLGLIGNCIRHHSGEGDLVFDGFMGSGTTAVAAKQLGRNYLGFELDPYYFGVATRRINETLFGEYSNGGGTVKQLSMF